MLRFSANLSLLFTEVELEQRFALAKQHGFNAVEIQFPYTLSPDTLKQLLADYQLDLVLFNVAADDLLQGGEGLAAVPEKQKLFQEAVVRATKYAEILQPEAINVLAGRCLNPAKLPQYLETFCANLQFAVQHFAPLGIKTVFEAINTQDMPGFIIHNSQQMLALIEQLNLPALYMQYDIYHMHIMGDQPTEFIPQHADKIGHIQFADIPGRGEPGSGTLDFNSIFAAIATSNYQGWTGAEYKPTCNTGNSFNWLNAQNMT